MARTKTAIAVRELWEGVCEHILPKVLAPQLSFGLVYPLKNSQEILTLSAPSVAPSIRLEKKDPVWKLY